MAHVLALLQWLPGRVNFTHLADYGDCSARPFPWARLAVDATFVRKNGRATWGADWFRVA